MLTQVQCSFSDYFGRENLAFLHVLCTTCLMYKLEDRSRSMQQTRDNRVSALQGRLFNIGLVLLINVAQLVQYCDTSKFIAL